MIFDTPQQRSSFQTCQRSYPRTSVNLHKSLRRFIDSFRTERKLCFHDGPHADASNKSNIIFFSMLTKLFQQSAVPREYRSNFLHLYFDIGWYGILSGSAINFLNIYATRIGATGFQIGLIGAMSAVVSLFLAIPTGRWLQSQNTSKAMFWSSVFYRIGFLAFIFLPMLSNKMGQIWANIAITLMMAIPLTPLGVGFNALFAEAVPIEY